MAARRWRSRAALALCTHAGVADPVEAMHRLVDSLLADAGVEELPVNLEVIASLRGVRKVELAAMPEAGMLIPDGPGYLIRTNERHPETRQRFTVAHEVAHTFFNEALAVSQQVSDKATSLYDDRDEEEYLCDVAAGRILLNPRWLQPMVDAERPSLDALLRLASCCLTSIEATAIQVSQLSLWECSLVFWEPGLRKAELARTRQAALPGPMASDPPAEKLRVRRVYAGPRVPFLPRNKSVTEGSHVWRAYAEETQTEGDDSIDLGYMVATARTQSIYAPYFDETGTARPRVVSCILWSRDPAAGTSRGL